MLVEAEDPPCVVLVLRIYSLIDSDGGFPIVYGFFPETQIRYLGQNDH
jgi:hypothetical protein